SQRCILRYRRFNVCSVLSFFFSSRRRHTRSKRDWSSDVCSSDLSDVDSDQIMDKLRADTQYEVLVRNVDPDIAVEIANTDRKSRSEERRVGKECRSRWGT